MPRVAVIADSHFDAGSRFDECVRVHRWIAADMRDRGVQLVLHSGDVFERKSAPAERAAVADWLQSVADFAPVVMVRGNHDAVGDLALFSRLDTRHPVIVEERAAMHHVAGVDVCCLAWPQTAHFRAATPDADPSDALRAVLRGWGSEPRESPRVLLAHAMVTGSRTSHGQPLVGHDMELGLADLALARADLVALGHIHMPQQWESGDGPVVYPGSPRRTSYGEVEEKGYVIAELGACGVEWRRIPTPCAPMLLIEGDWLSGPPPMLSHGECAGAEIRFRYTVPADQRDAARDAARKVEARWRSLGAADVKVEEEVIATATARAPEIAAAATTAEKLAALWRARKDEPAPERAARLIEMVNGLEAPDAPL